MSLKRKRRDVDYTALPQALLVALVRALRRKGAEVAAERDRAYDGLDQYEEGIGKLLAVAAHQQKRIKGLERQNAALQKQLESSLRWRRKLIARLRALQQHER